ncbi:MAG TPA: DUF5606 domain-containing protein [Chitinophagaceae bacterium]|nr:DUF5606 domain-containing protein [Chitinophagaceae bacterium]
MEYSKIISITGLGGLYELVGSKTDGAIVRSLDDKVVRFISSRQHNFSHLESVEVFTTGHNVNLVDVFGVMDKAGEALPSEKDPKAVKAYFEKVYPELDFERVYASDMKKIVKWFSILKNNDVEIKLAEEETPEEATEPVEEVTTATEEPSAPVAEETPAAKPAKKKAAPKAKEAAAEPAGEAVAEAPKKKAAKKKTEE